ncbi:MAG: LLM class flavin-dependent oxidoreductase [Candidatus Bathyarchaeota archaeon]|nr:LLM class flavin-dependent oxidoreductase [Candidatus Bathyarchaeota archaeon]
MKFGINISGIFPKAKNFPLSLFIDVATLSEELGYDGFFIPDHFNLPRSSECAEPFTTLAYIAAKTEKIMLGTIVSPLPRYVPPQLAKIIAHLDHLSNGRMIPGFGAGWHPEEFYTYAPDQEWHTPSERVGRTIEGVRLIRKLWTEDKVSFKGKYYSVKDAVLEPKPLQKPHPPIWSGGSGDYMLKMTAKYFDGWMPNNWRWTNSGDLTAKNYRRRMVTLRGYLQQYSRNPDTFTFGMQGGVTDNAQLVEAYREAGCNYYIAFIGDDSPDRSYPFSFNPDHYLELTRTFSKEVISAFI